MSETPMNKLQELCEKWQLPNINIRGDGGEGSTDISYSATRLQCAAELRAILPDVERLLEALREALEDAMRKPSNYAWVEKAEHVLSVGEERKER